MQRDKLNLRRFFLFALVVLILIAAIAYAVYFYTVLRWEESTDDAYANGNVVQVTALLPGTVVAIGADDTALVKAGQILVQFDDSDAHVALGQAEANLARAVRRVRGLYTSVGGLEADEQSRQIALDRTRDDLERRQSLANSGALPQEEIAHAKQAYAVAQSALTQARQQLATNEALVDDTVLANHPDVLAAAAEVYRASLELVRSKVLAPVTGYVAQRTTQVGQRVQTGTPLMAVVPVEQFWVEANFKETQLGKLRIGQAVKVYADSYGSDVVFHGHVAGLSMGTGSAFSLLPAQNATGNWIKIVQRVPVRIALQEQELREHPLRVGLSMNVDVDLHDQSGAMLATVPPSQPVFSTDVYDRALSDAHVRVTHIIEANSGTLRDTTRHQVQAMTGHRQTP